MNLRRFLPAALALALLAPTARATLQRYQCNVAVLREAPISGVFTAVTTFDGVATPATGKTTYFVEIVIDDAVADTDATTTKAVFPGALKSIQFFGPVATPITALTPSTTPVKIKSAGAVDIRVESGAIRFDCPAATPFAQAVIPIFGNPTPADVSSIVLTDGVLAAGADTGAGQKLSERFPAAAAFAGNVLNFFGSTDNGAFGAPDSEDILFFTAAGPVVDAEAGLLASQKAGVGVAVAGEPSGTTYAAFGAAGIGKTGFMAANTTLLAGAKRTAAVVAGAFPDLTVQARAGGAAPGVADGLFQSFSPVALSDAGKIAFLARLKSGAGGANATNNLGLWSDRAGALDLIARRGSPAPGLAGATVAALTDVAMDDDAIVFAGKVKGTGITPANDDVVWAAIAGAPFVALREGDTATDLSGGGTRTIKSFTALRTAKGVTGQGARGFLKGNFARLGVLAKFTDGTSGIIRIAADAAARTHTTLLVTGATPAGTPSGAGPLTKLALTSMVPGNTRFAARGRLGAKTDAVLGFVTGVNVFSMLAAPGSEVVNPGGTTVAQLGNPVVNSLGDTAWLGSIAGGGVTPASDAAICFVPFNGEVAAPVREGDAAPGIAGSKIKKFTGLALAEEVSGRFFFTAQLATGAAAGGVTGANDNVLCGGTAGAFTLLLREGDKLTLGSKERTVKSFTVFPSVRGSEVQRRAHAEKRVLARVNFTDGTNALVPLSLP